MLRLALIAIATSLLASAPAPASDAAPGRPKVALVLGGGAALGLSHVGVLRWFEEHRIPVDFVTGTSMGGLVGGLYATGMSSGEIAEFVKGINWDDALSSSAPYPLSSFRRKEDRRDFPNWLTFGIHKGIKLPAGLSAGHGVGMVLSRFTSRYDDLASFDELPIPFRCVATDLMKGEEVDFNSGRLFDAMRSTMAIPAVFTPWHIGDKVLVDGGTLNNLPVDVARKMGADIVIAVVLETPPIKEESVANVLGVAGRSISVMIANNEKRSMVLADLVLAPDLKGMSTSDYGKAEEFYTRGHAAAEEQAARLSRYALSPEEWERHLAQRRSRRRTDPPQPTKIAVNGAREVNEPALERLLEPALANPEDAKGLEAKLTEFTGLGRYQSADYRYTPGQTAETLDVDVREARYPSPILNTLLQIDATSGQKAQLGLGGRLTFYDLGGPDSELRTDFVGSSVQDYVAAEYYWRPNGKPFFLAPRIDLDHELIQVYRDSGEVAEVTERHFSFGLDTGVTVGRLSEFRLGFQEDRVTYKLKTGTLPVPTGAENVGSVGLVYRYEGQDSPLVPTRGLRFEGEVHRGVVVPSGRPEYTWVEGKISYAHPFNWRYSLMLNGAGGERPQTAGLYPLFTLGGTAQLSALAQNQLFGNDYYIGQAGVLRRMGSKPNGRFFAAAFYEGGSAWLDSNGMTPYSNATVGLIGETFFGILFGGFSVGDKGEHKFFVRMGRLF